MKRSLVQSSSLHSVGYDTAAQVLEVEFRRGGIYQYFGLPEPVYEALLNAASVGKFFQANIRDRFKSEKIG